MIGNFKQRSMLHKKLGLVGILMLTYAKDSCYRFQTGCCLFYILMKRYRNLCSGLVFFFGGGVTAGTYKYQQSPVKEHNVLTNDC